MTTTENNLQAAQGAENTAYEGDSAGEGQNDAHSGAETPKRVNKEAQYRVQRNEAREALAAAEQRIEALQRRELVRLASEHLSAGDDLLTLSGNSISDYLDSTGEIDAEKVAADVEALLAERPGLRRGPVPGHDPTQGYGGKPAGSRTPSWSALFS